MKKKLQVFISSTFTDMKEERQAAVEAILESGNIPAGMELFTSGNESQWETIKRWIDESDVYVLLLGGRYGSIEHSSGLSYTELEYDYAVSKKIPFFSIVINKQALKEKAIREGEEVIEHEEPGLLNDFHGKVLTRTSKFYKDPKDVKMAILTTLGDFLRRFEFSGWVSGDIKEELELYSLENKKLREEIETLQKIIDDNNSNTNNETNNYSSVHKDDSEFGELYDTFSKIVIKTKSLGESGIEFTYTLIDILVHNVEIFMTDRIGSMMNEKELFFNFHIFPKLDFYELSEIIGRINDFKKYQLTSKGKKFMAYSIKKYHSTLN